MPESGERIHGVLERAGEELLSVAHTAPAKRRFAAYGGVLEHDPEKPAPDVSRGGYRFSEKIMPTSNLERDDDSKKSHHAPVERRGAD